MGENGDFRERVYALVSQIPKGRVMTYGQIAALCGNPRAARIVGGIAHFGPTGLHTTPDCPGAEPLVPQELLAHRGVAASSTQSPYRAYGSFRASPAPSAGLKCEACGGSVLAWWRIVNKQGGLARGYTYGGLEGHKKALEADGVNVSDDFSVDIQSLLWNP